jgi:hypothetical protein
MTQAANLGALGTNAGTTGILPIAGGGTAGTNGAIGFKNRLINGNMVISQRNLTSSVTPTNGQYVLDRFQYNLSQTSKITTQQSSIAPVGFVNSLLVTSSSAYSLGAGDYFTITQPIEGYNVADLGWGTANAKTVTLSAWVYSSLTGTFGGSLMNGAFNYAYPFTYTISTANTWTQISVTVAGPTAGTWPTNNSASLQVNFSLGTGTTYSGTAGAWTGSLKFSATGAVSVVSTSGATLYLTGVQLEVGTAATNFDVRSFGTELQLCQRYYYKTFPQDIAPANGAGYTSGIGVPTAVAYTTGSMRNVTVFSQPMRAIPTVTYFNSNLGTPTTGVWSFYNGAWTACTAISNGEVSELYVSPNINNSGAFTFGYSYLVTGFLTASAEL